MASFVHSWIRFQQQFLKPMNEYLDITLRSVAVYIFIIVAIRLFGKKELAQLSVIDLVFILLISNAVQNAMVGPSTSLTGGLVAAATLFAVNYILKIFLFRSKSFTKLVQGDPVMLVHQGNLIEENMEREKISLLEVESAAREHGVATLGEVDLAILETDGNISILSNNYQKKSTRRRKAHKVLTRTA
jgi:uncharacterized membrane protein YcaP (DUF421 family)